MQGTVVWNSVTTNHTLFTLDSDTLGRQTNSYQKYVLVSHRMSRCSFQGGRSWIQLTCPQCFVVLLKDDTVWKASAGWLDIYCAGIGVADDAN